MHARHHRRRLVLLIGLFLLALFPNAGPPAVASPRVSGTVRANEQTFSRPAESRMLTRKGGGTIRAADAGSTGGETLLYSSPTLSAGQLFDRIGVRWIAKPGTESSFFVELRTSANATTWSGWELLTPDEDMHNPDNNEWYAAPRPAVNGARYAQYRVWLTDGDPTDVVRVGVTFMDVNDLNIGPAARLFNDVVGALRDVARTFTEPAAASAAPAGATRIYTRQDWAADESMMRWTPRYFPVQKAVVHHTVTADGGNNIAAEIRSIYYFHAVTRGWGDIGYNYLVDKYGNIWTGRQGGDGVEAGHAYGWNRGTFGVAAIGDYSVATPTATMVGGIANVIAMKFSQFGLQPFGADQFVHQEQAADGSWHDVTSNPPNIQGHRDCNYIQGRSGGQTACPGNGLYNQLGNIRQMAQNAVVAGYAQMPYLQTALPKASFPGAVINVGVTVVNRGKTTIPAGTSVSYRILQRGAVVVGQGASGQLSANLAPGASGSVTVPLTVPAIGSYVVRWDLQSGGSWWSGLYNTPVRDQWFRSDDWSADWLSDTVPNSWTAGETKQIAVTVANDGGRVWNAGGAGPVKLGYKWVSNATGQVFNGTNFQSLPGDVQPGQTVTIVTNVGAPAYPTNYTMILDLYKENEFAFADKGIAPDDTPIAVAVDFRATYALGATPAFTANQTGTVPVTITNQGWGTFPVANSFPVNLAYHWTTTGGTNVVWDGARTKLPADLLRGQSVQVNAAVTAPSTGGSFLLKFDLVQEGVAWFSAKGVATGNTTVNVAGAVVLSYGATYAPGAPSVAVTGTQGTIPITLTNRSNFSWPTGGANPVNLSYHWHDSGGRTVVWDGLRTSLGADLAANASVTLQANVRYPSTAGTYTLRWDLVHEGIGWFSGKGVAGYSQSVSVTPPLQYGATYSVSAPASIPTEIRTAIPVRLTNTSNFTWGPGVNLSYHWYTSASTSAVPVVWDGWRTPVSLAPGQTTTVMAQVVGPATPGSYVIRFDLVYEGVSWFSDKYVWTTPVSISAFVPQYGSLYTGAPQSVTAPANGTATVPITVKNTGTLTWRAAETFMSYHITTWADGVVVWDGQRTSLSADVAPGQSVTLNVAVRAVGAGSYVIKFDMVREGVSWFSQQSVPTGNVAATFN